MWAVTGWAIATWLKTSIMLVAAVAVCWLAWGTGSGAFWAVCAAAVLAEGYLTRQLCREWASEARSSWWWTP